MLQEQMSDVRLAGTECLAAQVGEIFRAVTLENFTNPDPFDAVVADAIQATDLVYVGERTV